MQLRRVLGLCFPMMMNDMPAMKIPAIVIETIAEFDTGLVHVLIENDEVWAGFHVDPESTSDEIYDYALHECSCHQEKLGRAGWEISVGHSEHDHYSIELRKKPST